MSWLQREVPSRFIMLLTVLLFFMILAPELWIALTRPDDLRLPIEHSMRQHDELHAHLAKRIRMGQSLVAAKGDPVRMSEIGAEKEQIERQLEMLKSIHQAEDESMREQVRKGIIRRGVMLGGLTVVVLVWIFWTSKPIDIESLPEISEKVGSICNDPNQKHIEAVKAYCDETGLGIREGRAAIDAHLAKQSEST